MQLKDAWSVGLGVIALGNIVTCSIIMEVILMAELTEVNSFTVAGTHIVITVGGQEGSFTMVTNSTGTQ